MGNWNDEKYFQWLMSFVDIDAPLPPSEKHTLLAQQLHETPYEWYIEMDSNRALDGVDMRYDFAESIDVDLRSVPLNGSSLLEVLVALALKAAYLSDGLIYLDTPQKWMEEMLTNVGLYEYTDDSYDPKAVTKISRQIMVKTLRSKSNYIFPKSIFTDDELYNHELWYQLNYYIEYLYSGQNTRD